MFLKTADDLKPSARVVYVKLFATTAAAGRRAGGGESDLWGALNYAFFTILLCAYTTRYCDGQRCVYSRLHYGPR